MNSRRRRCIQFIMATQPSLDALGLRKRTTKRQKSRRQPEGRRRLNVSEDHIRLGRLPPFLVSSGDFLIVFRDDGITANLSNVVNTRIARIQCCVVSLNQFCHIPLRLIFTWEWFADLFQHRGRNCHRSDFCSRNRHRFRASGQECERGQGQ